MTQDSCQHIYLGTIGRTNVADVVLAQAIRLAFVMNLQDERSSNARIGDEVDREVRRRVFWLLCKSDLLRFHSQS